MLYWYIYTIYRYCHKLSFAKH